MKKTIALVLTLVLIFALACPSAFAADKGSVYWLNFKPELVGMPLRFCCG